MFSYSLHPICEFFFYSLNCSHFVVMPFKKRAYHVNKMIYNENERELSNFRIHVRPPSPVLFYCMLHQIKRKTCAFSHIDLNCVKISVLKFTHCGMRNENWACDETNRCRCLENFNQKADYDFQYITINHPWMICILWYATPQYG